jgi:mannose-6-phosphate isomerase class I
MQIIGIVEGEFSIHHNGNKMSLKTGEFCLIPASLKNVSLQTTSPGSFLNISSGS